jgi:hypothetical protein
VIRVSDNFGTRTVEVMVLAAKRAEFEQAAPLPFPYAIDYRNRGFTFD